MWTYGNVPDFTGLSPDFAGMAGRKKAPAGEAAYAAVARLKAGTVER